LDVLFGELRRQIAGKSAANLLYVRRGGKLAPAPAANRPATRAAKFEDSFRQQRSPVKGAVKGTVKNAA
jgi:hypothetical protein